MEDDPEKETKSSKSEDVIFRKDDRSTEKEKDEIWDDSMLIKAYDKAVAMTYKSVGESRASATRNGEMAPGTSSAPAVRREPQKRKKSRKKKRSGRNNWKVGDACLARYSGDGELYPAQISSVDSPRGTCVVYYDDYGEEETLPLSQVFQADSVESEGGDEGLLDKSVSSSSQPDTKLLRSIMSQIPLLPPPPPPGWAQDGSEPVPTDSEALSSMLMSWYMSGYHTGYYQAMRDLQK